jgi:hypothetical protein
MKTVIFALLFLAIFGLSSTVRAGEYATLSDVDYPASIVAGEVFDITTYFTYRLPDGCLYRKPIYLFYSINNQIIILSSDGSAGDYFTQDYATWTPADVTFTIDADELFLITNDVFRFRIRYWQAILIDGYPGGIAGGMLTSAIYEITVVEAGEEPTETNILLLLSIIALATITITNKKRRN